MKPLPPSSRDAGFTLVEVLLAMAAATVLLAGVYGLVHAGTILSVKSLSLNASGRDVRLATDQAQNILLQAYDIPTLIDHTGAAVTGTGPAAGVKFTRYYGGPYVLTIPASGLSGTTTKLTLTRDTSSLVTPGPPQPNDIIVINTTILMTGESNQVRATVKEGSTVTSTTTGKRVAHTVQLTKPLGDPGTLIAYQANSAVTAIVIRPAALIIAPTANGRQLRHYESFNMSQALNLQHKHTVLTNKIALPSYNSTPAANDPMTDANARPFTLEKLYGRTFVNARFRIRDTRYARYLHGKQYDEYSTFSGVNAAIPSKCNPNE